VLQALQLVAAGLVDGAEVDELSSNTQCEQTCLRQPLRGNDVVTIVTFSPVQEQNTGFQEQQYHKVCAHAATSFIFPETLALADTNDAAFLLTFPTISLRYGLRGLGFFSVTLDRSLPASQTTKNSGGLL
jgi:hypothetical protein